MINPWMQQIVYQQQQDELLREIEINRLVKAARCNDETPALWELRFGRLLKAFGARKALQETRSYQACSIECQPACGCD